MHQALPFAPLKYVTDYNSRIQHLSDDATSPAPLLAHSHTRCLEDLSGRQVVWRVAKSYNLTGCGDERGMQFYGLKQLGGTKSVGVGDMQKMKDTFCEGAGADDAASKRE